MNIVVSTLLPFSATISGAEVVAERANQAVLAASQIDVSDQGTALQLDWPQISGATEIAVESAQITFLPPVGADVGLDLGHLKGSFSGKSCKVPISGGPRSIRSLNLSGLRLNDQDDDDDKTKLQYESSLANLDLRLAVAIEVDGVLAPVSIAVPFIAGKPANPPHTTPPLLVGGNYSNYVLTLPDVLADVIWLMVVKGDDHEDFAPQSFALNYVSARSAPSPLDITLLDGDGAPFYAGVGPVDRPTTIDARNPVARALETAVADAATPSVSLTVTSRTTGQLGTYGIVASGQVLRVFDEKLTATLEGAEVTPAIPGAALDSKSPGSATADVVIDHAGLRLHAISDPIPVGTGNHDGLVVSMDTSQWRALAPEAMRGDVLRRVGIIGFAPEAATLSLRVLGATPDGGKVAPPDLATAQLDVPAPDLSQPLAPKVFWFDLDQELEVNEPIGIEVSALTGRLLWVAEDDRPLVRFAVSHTPVGGELVLMGNHTFTLTGTQTVLNGATISPGVFAAPPKFRSDHFVTVTLSRLTLGYAP